MYNYSEKCAKAHEEQNRKRHEQAEAKYRRLFSELGYDETFEFIFFEGNRRIRVKCRQCGLETTRDSSIFKGKQSKLLCRACGNGRVLYSPFVDEVLAYYQAGHSVKETCEKFEVKETRLNDWVKYRKVTNGRTISEINTEKAKASAAKAIEKTGEKLKGRLEALGFELISNYKGRDTLVTIKCRQCGQIYERTPRHCMKGNAVCKVCQHNEAVIRQAEKEKQKQFRAMRKLIESTKLSTYQLSQQKKLDEKQICKVCGNSYTIRYWQALTGTKYVRASGYCSLKCQKDSQREREKGYRELTGHDHGNSRRRCRKYNTFYSGHKITWKTLANKRGLSFDEIHCEICGRKCDPHDHSWSRYTGPLHPSVDHIIALANGGGDVWDNVRLACMECNSRLGGKTRQNNRDYIEKRWDNGND